MKVVELALKAGRKRQSAITRFVHFNEVIPIYENFCFALALLRSRIAENVLEAKALLERLLAFQVSGEFPTYLHEYPYCRPSKIYPVIFFILRDFHTVLGEKLRIELQKLPGSFSARSPESPEEWGEFLIQAQMTDPTPAFQHWSPDCLAFVGPQKQEKSEPAVTLYDLFMGQWSDRFSTRALQDHPVHLQASLIYPGELKPSSPANSLKHHFWGSGHPTHSLVLKTQGKLEGSLITLPEKEVQDEVEIAYFCNVHPSTEIFINGQRATTFQLGDTIRVGPVELAFEGEGQFWGHLYRGNRKGQLAETKFEAYDWIIALRTVKRGLSSTIKIRYNQINDTRSTR